MLKIDEVRTLYGEDMAIWYEAMVFAEDRDFDLVQDLFLSLEGFCWLALKANEYRLHADKEWKQKQLRKMD